VHYKRSVIGFADVTNLLYNFFKIFKYVKCFLTLYVYQKQRIGRHFFTHKVRSSATQRRLTNIFARTGDVKTWDKVIVLNDVDVEEDQEGSLMAEVTNF
jgi:hypothetical protein